MAIYKYTGRNEEGSLVKGSVESNSKDNALELVMAQGILPSELHEKVLTKHAIDFSALFNAQVKLTDLVIFTRQMYSLTKAGVPILRALNGLAESTNSPLLANALFAILNNMKNGYSLSVAMAAHPRVFSQLYVSLVQVGENTGQLERVFLQLSAYIEQEINTKKRVKNAIRYPSFVLFFVSFAMVILNIYVIPVFANMFAKFNADLPWATHVLMSTSALFVNYWGVMLALVTVLLIAVRFCLNDKKGAYYWDKWKLRLPIIGSIIERSLLARFSRSFAMMLTAGVPLNHALYLIAFAVDNHYLKTKILTMRSEIESGDTLLKTATKTRLFTPLVLQMIAVGEETGQVDELLKESADFYEREVDYDLKSMTAKMEPLLITLVGIMIAILAFGIFTPMWSIMSAIKGG